MINQVVAQPTSCECMNLGKGTNEESGNCIAKDAQGNIYVAGTFSSQSMTLGNVSLKNSTQTGAPKQDIL
jgi:hypothetical protein